MAYKSAWYNEDVMVDIITDNIICPTTNDNALNKVIVQDNNNKFYYRDAGSFGGGPLGPTGPFGPTGPLGPTGPFGIGTGNVNGPLSSTNKALALFNGTLGNNLMNSGIITDSTSQGLIFSNSSLTSSDDQLDYYELNEFVMDFQSTGGGLVLSAVPIRIFRMGKLIQCQIGTQSANQINTGVLQSTTTLSPRYLPDNQTTLYGLSVITDGAQIMGALNINVSGYLQIAILATSGSVVSLGSFQGSQGIGTKINGTWQNSHVSWMLA